MYSYKVDNIAEIVAEGVLTHHLRILAAATILELAKRRPATKGRHVYM